MTSEQFAKDVYQDVVINGLDSYRKIYSTSEENATDPFYKKALRLYSVLSEEQKKVLFEIIRQVEVDTAASLLAILDGQRHDGHFTLSYEMDNTSAVISDALLSDLFLEIDEMGFENFD